MNVLDSIAPQIFPSILRGLKDPVEKVREKCVGLLQQYVSVLGRDASTSSRLIPVLKTLVPSLVQIAGAGSGEEPSEEIRLEVLRLVSEIVKFARGAIASYADELTNILTFSVNDQYHEVKKTVHGAVRELVKALSFGNRETSNSALLKHQAGKILASLLPDAQHRHSEVRKTCLRAVSSVTPFCTSTEISEILTPGIRCMCFDRTPGVRSAFHTELKQWMVMGGGMDGSGERNGLDENENAETDVAMSDAEGTEGNNDNNSSEQCLLPHAVNLLPMLLTGIADEVEANAQNALRLVEEVGAANDEALRKRFGDAILLEANSSSEESDIASAARQLLPFPFSGPENFPTNASRRLIRSSLPTLLPHAISETREWTSVRRNVGAGLLGTVSVFGRSSICESTFLPKIIHALEDAVVDEDTDTAERIILCAKIIGAYSHNANTTWIPILQDSITGDGFKVSDGKRAASLVILAAIVFGSSRFTLDGESVLKLSQALSHGTVLGCDHTAVRAQCLTATVNLIKVAAQSGALKDSDSVDSQSGKNASSANLFRVLLQMRAAESPEASDTGASSGDGSIAPGALPPKGASQAAHAMESLAVACGFESVDELYKRHADEALKNALSESKNWTSPNPSQRTFCAFVLDAPCSVFDTDTAVCSKAVQVFESVSHQANDPVVRVALLRTLDAAFEDDGEDIPEIDSKMNRGAALVGGDDARAVALIRNVVLESLVWKAGATAAAARYAAIVCLGTMLRGSLGNNSQTTNALPITQSALFAVMKENNSSLLPSIFSAMEEDYYAETRRAACYALRGVLATVGIPIGDERRRSIYPELLKRMDDSRDDIRIAASKCVETFFERCVSPDWDSTNCLYLLKPFVVHMDDGDEGVRDAVLRAVLAAAKVKPEVVVEVLTPALEQHRCVAHVQKGLEAARGK